MRWRWSFMKVKAKNHMKYSFSPSAESWTGHPELLYTTTEDQMLPYKHQLQAAQQRCFSYLLPLGLSASPWTQPRLDGSPAGGSREKRYPDNISGVLIVVVQPPPQSFTATEHDSSRHLVVSTTISSIFMFVWYRKRSDFWDELVETERRGQHHAEVQQSSYRSSTTGSHSAQVTFTTPGTKLLPDNDGSLFLLQMLQTHLTLTAMTYLNLSLQRSSASGKLSGSLVVPACTLKCFSSVNSRCMVLMVLVRQSRLIAAISFWHIFKILSVWRIIYNNQLYCDYISRESQLCGQ